LVLRHQMPVWNYFVNSFYSVPASYILFKIKPDSIYKTNQK
jgi:hypothetical protein